MSKARGGHDFDEALGRRGHFGRVAIFQHHGEFVAGVTRDEVALAAIFTQALGQAGDHLIGDVIAIGAVQHEQAVDADQERGEGLLALGRLGVEMRRLLQQAGAVQRAGQRVEAGFEGELPFLLVSVGDDAHEAMGARGAAIVAGEPAARVFDPDGRFAWAVRRNEPITDLERHALAGVGRVARPIAS